MGAVGIAVIVLQVRYSDISLLEKTTILAKMEEETSIYYLDGQERIGSLFSGVHRRYVPLRDIPAHMQNAIIAAEDKNFFLHRGVDYGAILIAFYEGLLQGGRFRRGGSTLTQQTVKNIMGDWEATFARKFREMIKAMQLEQLYDKEQILEFYLNQFHVVGNGNGIGIAANYYFNKDVLDLNLIEAAFIAGSVKSPSRYNPFMKRDQTGLKRALQQGRQRKNYVLTRMFEQRWISAEEYARAKTQPIPFDKGRFTTSDVTLVDMIQAELARKDILEATGLKHISELKTAGLKVYTTIDKDLQHLAQHMSRRHFARIQTILSGLIAEDSSSYKPLKTLTVGQFVFGKVTRVTAGDEPQIELSFGLPTGTLDSKALIRMAKLLNLPEDHPGGYQHFLELLLTQITVDDVLFVEVKDYDSSTFKAALELYKHPDVSGGLVVLDKGEVRAMISGFDTLGFNRAIHGKRQPGSVFKIPTLLAALQLGWTILDPLYNNRQVFAYQNQVYFPRPDHPIKYPRPSLIWSGIMSENLAFVHLMVHLLDKLSFPQFKQLLAALHLAPKPRESPHIYQRRVERRLGVRVDQAGLNQHLLQQAVAITEPDFIFSRDLRRADLVRTLWWGHNYVQHMQALYREDRQQYSVAEIETRLNLVRNNYQRYQRLLTSYHTDLMLLEYHLERYDGRQIFYLEDLQAVLPRFGIIETAAGAQLIYHRTFADEVYALSDNAPYETALKAELTSEYDKEMALEATSPAAETTALADAAADTHADEIATKLETTLDPTMVVDEDEAADEERTRAIATRLYGVMAGWPVVPLYSIGGDPATAAGAIRALQPEDLPALLDDGILANPEATLLDGRMPVSMVRFIENYIATELADLHDEPDPYKLKQMFSHHDFRIALGLQYLKQLCRILGVKSYINPVISLPLGTNVVTTADIARLFQAVATGHIYQFFPDDEPNQMAFIRRIEDRYGKVLYAAAAKTYDVLHPLIRSQLTDVLRKIVTHGTGRRAGREMYIDLAEDASSNAPAAFSSRYKIRIPAYGKTGSTNDFTTSYFAGLTPYPISGSDQLSMAHIYTMAAYVGYDIPQMMERGRISIYGGTGALPLWTDFFRHVIRLKDYRSYLDAYDLDLITNQEWAVHRDPSQWEPVRVDLPRGLVLGPITEKYVEDYKLTNLAETGEEYVNEFLNIHSVIGAVNAPAPLDLSRPLPRLFEPLTPKLLHQKIEAAGDPPLPP